MALPRFVTLLCLCALDSACAPTVFTMHDGLRGSVLDARNHQPVEGAEVAVSTAAGQRVASARSDTDGTFSVPAQRQTGLYVAGMTFGVVRDSVVVRCAGYRPERRTLARTVASPFGSSMEEVGSVALQPAPR